MTANTIPMTVSEEAAAHIREQGLQRPVEQILDYFKQNVPGLEAVEVTLDTFSGDPPDPAVCFDVRRNVPFDEKDRTHWNWMRWFVDTFPPEVARHFTTSAF